MHRLLAGDTAGACTARLAHLSALAKVGGMTLTIRLATVTDAPAMCLLINRIIAIGGTTAFRDPFDDAMMRDQIIAPPGAICCHLAQDAQGLAGFQALFMADPAWDGPDPLGPDWGLIGTYVAAGRQGQGIGKSMFAATKAAARAAGITRLDATIRRENTGGLAYYTAMGFVDWRADANSLSKRFDL